MKDDHCPLCAGWKPTSKDTARAIIVCSIGYFIAGFVIGALS